MNRWYQSRSVAFVFAGAYFLLLLGVLMLAAGCAPESLTMSIHPADADAHPELVETIQEAIADKPELKLVISPTSYGPRWHVVDEVPCKRKCEACVQFEWDMSPETAQVYVTRGATARLDVVSHEIGHVLDPSWTHPYP